MYLCMFACARLSGDRQDELGDILAFGCDDRASRTLRDVWASLDAQRTVRGAASSAQDVDVVEPSSFTNRTHVRVLHERLRSSGVGVRSEFLCPTQRFAVRLKRQKHFARSCDWTEGDA
jgi:hypothetical protein